MKQGIMNDLVHDLFSSISSLSINGFKIHQKIVGACPEIREGYFGFLIQLEDCDEIWIENEDDLQYEIGGDKC